MADRAGQRLAPGTRLGAGRYTIREFSRRSRFGDLYHAVDTTSSHEVTVHVIDGEVSRQGNVGAQVIAHARRASAIAHPNITQVITAASEGAHLYVVTEALEGHTLRELLVRKQETGSRGFNAKAASNLLSQICSALTAVHSLMPHGAVSLEGIVVNRAGQAKLTDIGLSAVVAVRVASGVVEPTLPPEASRGQASPASDLYAVGALLYELVVGAAPHRGCTRPSEAVQGVSADVDVVVGAAMAPDPAKRPATADALRAAVTAALAAPARPSGPVTVPAAEPAPASAPKASNRPSLAQAITAPPIDPGSSGSAPAPSASGSMNKASSALSAAMADSHERWLVSKGKLDYGPFTFQSIVDQIRSNTILPGHTIIDNTTGTRLKAEDHPLLGELIEEAKQKRDDARRAQAEEVHAKQEKRRGFGLYGFIGVTVVALGLGAFFIVQKLQADKAEDANSVSGLDEGSLQAKISFPTSSEGGGKGKRTGGKRRGGGGGGGGGVKGGWNDTVDLGDASEGGGDERLSDAEINPVVSRHGGKLGRCLSSTGSSSADVWFQILGSGRVSYVKVNGETGSALANCIRGVMKGMQFPSFNGARTKANFSMSM